jgi:predicted glycosyltransferase
LLRLKGVEAMIVGKHGGASLYGKLLASSRRVSRLAKLIHEWKPKLAISFPSGEAARVAFGLAIPYFCVGDSPHAEAQSKLAVPLSNKLFTPKIIPKSMWTCYGIPAERIIHYDALDPVVWIRGLKPSEEVLDRLGLNSKREIVAIRLEEAFAAYLLGKTSDRKPIALDIIKELLDRKCDAQIVALPRYGHQALALKRKFKERITLAESVIDGPSLLSFASVFIGAGGTMTTEAALLGVPSISCYPSDPTCVEKYLIRLGLVKRLTKPKEIAEKTLEILNDKNYRERQKKKSKLLISKMEDPLEVIIREVEKLPA